MPWTEQCLVYMLKETVKKQDASPQNFNIQENDHLQTKTRQQIKVFLHTILINGSYFEG